MTDVAAAGKERESGVAGEVAALERAASARAASAVPQTLDRLISVLDLFQPETPEWGAAAIARELDLSLPTASRFLRALEHRGFLMRTDGRRYRLGFGAVELGFRALRSIDIRERVHPVLVQLAHASGETTVLGTLTEQRDAARVIDRVEGNEYLRISLEIGHSWPLHAGALAKALLATMPDRDHVLEQPLTKLCQNTITDRGELLEELAAIRRRGWARSVQETEVAAWGVAAAVPDRTGAPVASIGLISPLDRRSPAHEARLVELLLEAVEAARSRLGLEDRHMSARRAEGVQP